jgi:hypothetical protein
MATGFVDRFKGKINADVIFLKGWGMSEVSTALGSTVGSTAGSTLSADRSNYVINASSAAVVYTLPPVEPGALARLLFLAVSSGVFIKASTVAPNGANNFGVQGAGGSTATVLKATAQMTVGLIGVSSISWAVDTVWSTYSTVAAVAQPVFSTTT